MKYKIVFHAKTHLKMPYVTIGHSVDAYPNLFHSGLILGLRPANERRRYKVTPSLIGWAQT